MPKIEEKRFVVFGEAIIEVNRVIAVAGTVLRSNEPAIVIILDTNSTVTLAGESMALFMGWWKEKMQELTEKTELSPELVAMFETPVPIEAPVATTPPVVPEPASTPILTPETVVPNIVSEVAAQVAPEPPPPPPVAKPPRLDEIGKASDGN